ncbi:MAG: hypothetical protein EAZ97_03710 [Bacteroidetes bacterium]|nr:MAG: hypothetical protein EAZ97_03710 [Bacteroidota bacterium]
MKKIFLVLVLLFSTFLAQAQYPWWFSGNNFGKNRIQHQSFEWKYLLTQNFEIYFYGEGLEIAKLAAQYAESDFSKTIDMVGYSPYNRIKIFVYHSTVELDQSNIGLSQQDFAIGGQTDFFKPEVEVAFTGHKASFKKMLTQGITNVLIAQMMYGGNLKERLQSAYLLVLPEWFLSGASAYTAEGWSLELDDYMRDMLLNRKIVKLSNLEGKDAQRVGQSIWNFVAEEYGSSNVASIMNLTRIVRDEEASFRNTLGLEFDDFLKKWKNYYLKQFDSLEKDHQKPNERQKLEYNKKNTFYNHVKIQPKGEWVAYTENKKGRYRVRLKNLISKAEKTIFSGGYKVINQDFDLNIPLISWKDNETLAIIDAKKGKNTLWLYKIGQKARIERVFNEFEHIEDLDVSDDGNWLVMSAENHGKSDIYEYSLVSKSINQLSNDEYDDLHPHYLRNSRDVVFTSNRLNDSLVFLQKNIEISDRFNIFLYKSQEKRLQRITNTLSNDSKPLPINENYILFLSDQRGIVNLFRYDLTEQISTQISNFEYSLQNYDFIGKKLAQIMFFKGKDQIFVSDFDVNQSFFTQKTVRQQILDFRQLSINKAKKKNQEKQEKEVAKNKEIEVEEPKIDSIKTIAVMVDEVDTDNYQFDATISKPKRKKLLKDYNPLAQIDQYNVNKLTSFGNPKSYETQFGVANTNFYPVIDPLRDWGLVLEGSISDVLENHKVKAGIFNFTNLANSATYVEYDYLKGRFDYRFRAERSSLRKEFQAFAQRYVLNKAIASITYPLSVASSLRFSPFLASTSFSVSSPFVPNIQSIPDQNVSYGGFSAEFIFDNSVVTSLNMMNGIKFKVSYENYTGLGKDEKSFGNLAVDLRVYKQLGRAFMFASRLSYGTFFGNSRKNYRLGGMSNWISFKEDPLPNKDPLYPNASLPANDYSDLLFTQYITGLRGFNYNKLFGNNYILFNAEIRMSILPLLKNVGLTSNFFRNLQFIAFTDVGSCWTGVSPFNRENSLNTIEIETKPFFAKVSNFKNPFLMSYGAGVRTTVLGYFTKFDVAWGVDDQIISSAQYYWTLGYDF